MQKRPIDGVQAEQSS